MIFDEAQVIFWVSFCHFSAVNSRSRIRQKSERKMINIYIFVNRENLKLTSPSSKKKKKKMKIITKIRWTGEQCIIYSDLARLVWLCHERTEHTLRLKWNEYTHIRRSLKTGLSGVLLSEDWPSRIPFTIIISRNEINEYMNEWIDRWMAERMDGWIAKEKINVRF